MAKMCDYPGCSNPVFSKGKCSWHQERAPIENKSSKPISPLNDKRAAEYAVYRKRRDEYFKEHPVCEFQGCYSRNITLHHKRGKIGKMLIDKKWFCSLCQFHHQWVNENSKLASKMGLVYSRLGK